MCPQCGADIAVLSRNGKDFVEQAPPDVLPLPLRYDADPRQVTQAGNWRPCSIVRAPCQSQSHTDQLPVVVGDVQHGFGTMCPSPKSVRVVR